LDYLTTHTSLSPIRRGFAPSFVNYKKGCTRLAAASDKVYQLLAQDLVALNTIKIKSNQPFFIEVSASSQKSEGSFMCAKCS